jgi:transposase
MMTIDQVAAMHGFSVPTVYGWTRQTCVDGLPVLPVVKYGRRVRVRASDAEQVPERLLQRLRRPSSFFMGEVSGS